MQLGTLNFTRISDAYYTILQSDAVWPCVGEGGW